MPADVAHNVPGTTRGKLRTNPEARTDTTSALTMARWASRQTPPLNHPGSVSCTCMRCTASGTTTWLTGVAYEVAITSDAHGKRASSRVIHAMKHVPRLRPAKLVVEGFPHLVHARARVANLKPAPWCCQQQLPRPLPSATTLTTKNPRPGRAACPTRNRLCTAPRIKTPEHARHNTRRCAIALTSPMQS